MRKPRTPFFITGADQIHGTTKPRNHGAPWSLLDAERLRSLYHNDATLSEMCEILGRTPSSLVAQLSGIGYIAHTFNGKYECRVESNPTNFQLSAPTKAALEHVRTRVSCEQDHVADLKEFQFGASLTLPTKITKDPNLWEIDELSFLLKLYDNSLSLYGMCHVLRRMPEDVLKQLVNNFCINTHPSAPGKYFLLRKRAPVPYTSEEKVWVSAYIQSLTDKTLTTPSKEEAPMKALTIENKTFIDGVDSERLSDDELFAKIADLEAAAAKWEKLKNRPKTLDAQVEKLLADAKRLAEFIDARATAKKA